MSASSRNAVAPRAETSLATWRATQVSSPEWLTKTNRALPAIEPHYNSTPRGPAFIFAESFSAPGSARTSAHTVTPKPENLFLFGFGHGPSEITIGETGAKTRQHLVNPLIAAGSAAAHPQPGHPILKGLADGLRPGLPSKLGGLGSQTFDLRIPYVERHGVVRYQLQHAAEAPATAGRALNVHWVSTATARDLICRFDPSGAFFTMWRKAPIVNDIDAPDTIRLAKCHIDPDLFRLTCDVWQPR
jgi:hypothetical protein